MPPPATAASSVLPPPPGTAGTLSSVPPGSANPLSPRAVLSPLSATLGRMPSGRGSTPRSPRSPRGAGGSKRAAPLPVSLLTSTFGPGPLTQEKFETAQAAYELQQAQLPVPRHSQLSRVPKPSLLRRVPAIKASPGVPFEWHSGPLPRTGLFAPSPRLDEPLESELAMVTGRRGRHSHGHGSGSSALPSLQRPQTSASASFRSVPGSAASSPRRR